jgi:hypothetical protein
MTYAPPPLACARPPFLAHICVVPRSQWMLPSCYRQECDHRTVVQCTLCGALTLRTLSPLMTRHTTGAGGGARVRRRDGHVGEASRDRV